MLPESLLFDRDEIVKRGEYELEHAHLYTEDPPGWFTKFFFGCDNTTHNTYNMARVVAEAVVMRFEVKLTRWVDDLIDERIQRHYDEEHRHHDP